MARAPSSLLRFLGNIPVGRKLTLGFGLVLCSTLGVALTAFNSISVLGDHSEQLRTKASIHSLILQARVAEKDFALDLDARSAVEVQAKVEQLLQTLDDQPSTVVDWSDVRTSAHDYLTQFLAYADSMRQVKAARLRMQALANAAGESFITVLLDRLDAVTNKVSEGVLLETELLTLLENSAGLRDKLAKLRDSELSFSLDGEERYSDDWEASMSALLSDMQMLTLRLSAEEQQSLKAAQGALSDYRGAFEQFVEGRKKARRISLSMNEEAQRVAQVLGQANERQERAMQLDNENAHRQLVVITLLAVLLGGGAILLLRQQLLTPLREVVALAQRVAKGDLSSAPDRIDRRDELGQLLTVVHQMLANLRGLVSRIGEGVGRLHLASDDLVQVNKRTSQGVDQQRQETELAAHSMELMASTALAVARSASEASEAVTQAEGQAREGDELVSLANSKIERLALEMSGAAGAMQSLMVESTAIGGVLDVIKGIADQTNLLALNAAVEAARAGEYGRGFAVVADEVRGLAKRTRVSTQEIESLIGRLQVVTQQAGERLKGSHVLTDEAAVLAKQASQSLSRITQAVSRIDQMNKQITGSAAEQSTAARNASENMGRVRAVAEGGVRESESLQVATTDLRLVGDELNSAVGHFVT